LRILVLQNGLKSRSTHFYNESLAWRRLCKARDIPCHIVAHRQAPRELLDELGAVAGFPAGPDASFYIDDKGTRGRPQEMMEQVFADVCVRAFGDRIRADDMVVVPYARVPELGGLARWLAQLPAGQRPFVVVLLHRPEEEWRVDATRQRIVGDPGPMREAAARLDALATRGLLVLATNAPLAGILRSALAMDVTLCPPLYSYRFQEHWFATHGQDERPSLRGRSFDLGLLGQMRPEKGGAVALDGIKSVLARRQGLQVAMHVRDDEAEVSAASQIAAAPGQGNVTLLTGEMSHDEFLLAIGACRIIVLPYDPQRYRARLSGPLVEAAAWGRPVIVPADTWMADMVSRGRVAGVVYPSHNAAEMCRAMLAALDGYETLAAQAREAAVTWRAERSIDKALDLMLARRAAALA
jgi:glycosyltransferase involved in cell wall biosynthesis